MANPTIVDTSRVYDEIPDPLRKLARFVIKGFYSLEQGLVFELLIRNVCMRENEIRDVLKFDAKLLRQILLALKSDKLIKERQETIQKADGSNRTIKNNYYFINYRMVVNVLKYKIDHIRLNEQDREDTHRSLFRCTGCPKTYDDTDMGQIWRGDAMVCTFCNGRVEEDISVLPTHSTRSLVSKFNEQMQPFLDLLRETEDVRLAPHLLEPIPMPLSSDSAKREQELAAAANGRNYGRHPGYGLNYTQGFTVSIGEESDSFDAQRKEVPVWLQTSSIDQTAVEPASNSNSIAADEEEIDIPSTSARVPSHPIDTAVFAALARAGEPSKETHEESDDSEFEEVTEQITVLIKGQPVPLSEITPEMVNHMTAAEKENYTKATQQLYYDSHY